MPGNGTGPDHEGEGWRPTFDGDDQSDSIGDEWRVGRSGIPDETSPSEKRRHGCLTAWLVLMLVTNGGLALVYLLYGRRIGDAVGVDRSQIVFLALIGVVNVVCAIALLSWKRWGFWGFVASSVVVFVINVINGVIVSALFGLVGIVVLWTFLQSGNPKAWDQLE